MPSIHRITPARRNCVYNMKESVPRCPCGEKGTWHVDVKEMDAMARARCETCFAAFIMAHPERRQDVEW